ncbi:hypothetical protein BSL78_19027 [Apostichopus japonicus]|uniref:Carbohydrate sulfotransferase 15 n=1 Tax=Stichopus japonicus TaxID=307972 RepID=A0A2G8K7X3_STIJA|nr:hypothetical protein BSL78_19027 [Apostichopus japonicus]
MTIAVARLFVAALLFLCVAVATILHSTSLFRLKEIRRDQVFNSYIVRQLVGLSPSNGANMRSEGQVTATTTSRNQTSEFVFDVDQSNGLWKTSYSNVSEDIGWKKPSGITGGESQQIDLQTSPMTHANESTDLDHQKPAIGLLEGLKRIRPQIMSDYPSSFLANYKNPCYKKASDGKLHCLPYFFLLGTPKSGTTDIWSKIVQHPDVVCRAKEPHWWTRKSYRKISDALMKYCRPLEASIEKTFP